MTALPSRQVLSDIITGKKSIQFEFLAIKIFLGMAAIEYKRDQGSLEKSVQKFVDLLEKFQKLPAAQKDIQKLI